MKKTVKIYKSDDDGSIELQVMPGYRLRGLCGFQMGYLRATLDHRHRSLSDLALWSQNRSGFSIGGDCAISRAYDRLLAAFSHINIGCSLGMIVHDAKQVEWIVTFPDQIVPPNVGLSTIPCDFSEKTMPVAAAVQWLRDAAAQYEEEDMFHAAEPLNAPAQAGEPGE